mgnify:CR=1 FL=1
MEFDKSTDQPLVFISYSHRDRELCKQLSEILESKTEVHVWYDKELMAGEAFRKKIVEAIRNSDYFVVLLSGDSILSEWVLDEVEYAKKLHKRILPVYTEETKLPDELDMILHRYHCLFWYLRSSNQQFEGNLLRVFQKEKPENFEYKEGTCPFNEFSATLNKEMQQLLEAERDEKYAVCYSANNACLLGMAYLFGGTCAIDREKARFYFHIAEYQGNPEGTLYLLMMKLEDREDSTWDEPDETFCAPILEKIEALAEDSCEPAKLFLAHVLWYGRYGYKQDLKRSAELYESCARGGNARAQYMMASNYYYGDGVKQDYALAIMYANLAMVQGYPKSWRRWGEFYQDGLAVKKDYRKAREFYEKGAKMGDYNCYNKVGDMFYYGWGFPMDYQEAVKYYLKGERAPEQGQKFGRWKAKQALGRCFELGHGVELNLETAAEKYLEGYQCGSSECKEAYIRCSTTIKKQHK